MSFNRRSSVTSKTLRHLTRSGLDKTTSKRIVSQLISWEKSSGPEWTIERLKTMKNYILQRFSGNPSPPHPWVKVDKKGYLSGSFKAVHKLFDRDPLRALSIMNVYTAYISPKVTYKQALKAMSTIEADIDPEKSQFFGDLGYQFGCNFFTSADKGRSKINFEFYPVGMNSGKPKTFSTQSWVNSFIEGCKVPSVNDYLSNHFKDYPKGLSMNFGYIDPLWNESPGTISCIQERGFKARVVAVPNAAVQVALRPLHKRLESLLRSIRTDCTYNQEEGAEFAKRKLEEGKTVYSVDLSSATDFFPRSFQMGVLYSLGLDQEADLIDTLSQSPWFLSKQLDKLLDKEFTSYHRGQPQGLQSSFPLFALSHNLLCINLATELGLDPDDSFRILGDDIVISEKSLNDSYRQVLEHMGCPISESKSFKSNKLAEFAGYLISDSFMDKPPKVPKASSRNFVSYVKAFGPSAIADLPSKLRPLARCVAELPEHFGGLGYNPEGKSLEERISPLVEKKLKTIPKYTSITPDFMRSRIEWKSSEDATEVLYWLSDQETNISNRLYNWLLDKYPKLANVPTEMRSFCAQLDENQGDVQGLVNYYNTNVSSGYSDEYSNWSNRLNQTSNTMSI